MTIVLKILKYNYTKKVSNFHNSQTEGIFSYYDIEHGDSLTIYDGSDDQSTQIEKLSGDLESFGISSIGNSLFVIFESSYYINYKGFFARIQYGNPHLHIKQYFKTCLS